MSKKILLLTAPRPDSNGTAMHLGDKRPPLGLGILAEYVRQFGHEAKIIDLYIFGGGYFDNINCENSDRTFSQESNIDLDLEIEKFNPDYIGIYIATLSHYKAIELSKLLKSKYPNIPLIAGGPQAIHFPELLTSHFDYVIISEGEIILRKILDNKYPINNIPYILMDEPIEDLDTIPMINYSDFINNEYNWKLGNLFGSEQISPTFTLSTTRGCPYGCRFCGVSRSGFRSVSPKILIDYISHARNTYNINGVYFREDNFTINTKRTEKFCDMLISSNLNIKWACESRIKHLTPTLIKKMANAGCIGLYIGVESGSERILSYIQKQETKKDFVEKFKMLKDNGIGIYTTWIFGVPTETHDDRMMTLDFQKELEPAIIDEMVYLGQPGSKFYEMLNTNKDYEFKEENGIFYPHGFLSLAKQVWKNDDRCKYVEQLYKDNNVIPTEVEF